MASEFKTKTFLEFHSDIKALAAGFFINGVKKGSHVSFFTDNRYEWAITDYALQLISAISVPRGTDTAPLEQKMLYLHSDSSCLVMENSLALKEFLNAFNPGELPVIDNIFIMDRTPDGLPEAAAGKTTYYEELLESGRKHLISNPSFYSDCMAAIEPDKFMTIIYTSGTSGSPKGVMLSHNNFLHNVRNVAPLLEIDPAKAEPIVTILPSWHVYERCFEYCAGAYSANFIYSSVKHLQEDLYKEKPTIMASVPRVWETFYEKMISTIKSQSKIKQIIFNFFVSIAKLRLNAYNYVHGHVLSFKKRSALRKFAGKTVRYIILFLIHPFYLLSIKVLSPLKNIFGGNMRASFSAGGSLPIYIDLFFNAVGIKLVNAYGMTETSPGIITRTIERNTLGAIGIILKETNVKILKENGWPASPGEKGVIYIKGEQVMKGYYRNPEATKAILSEDGWLNTGDIAVMSFNGDILMTGRAKATIVLLGGENAEPEPIEEKLMESVFIDHAVVFGQDKKGLTAIIAVNEDKLKHMAAQMKISWSELTAKGSDIIKHNKVLDEMNKEIKRLVNRRTGFKPFERISKFIVTVKKFSIGDELTQTLKVKRKDVEKKYKDHLK
jgi:long-chain acyl-CoA synthetase